VIKQEFSERACTLRSSRKNSGAAAGIFSLHGGDASAAVHAFILLGRGTVIYFEVTTYFVRTSIVVKNAGANALKPHPLQRDNSS
jgi:hypothetical protein